MKPKTFLIAAAAAAAMLLSCGKSGGKAPKPVTIRWWHINTDKPSSAAIASIAADFEAANPGTDVEITILENMEYKQKLELEFAGKNPPDLFHSWGSGGMAEQAEAGLLKDVTSWVTGPKWKSRINPAALALYSHKGRVSGFPHDLGAVGLWYNEKLLAKAGWKAFPEDWRGFKRLLGDLRDAGVAPIALGVSDRWPVMYYWAYFALRIGGPGIFSDILEGRKSFTDPAMVEAARMLQELSGLDCFQPTWIGDDFHTQSRWVGDGNCAMQLMGQWALALQEQVSESKAANTPFMRFAPFPAIEGRPGTTLDVMGGGNGFVVSAKAPDRAVELLEFFTRPENLQRYFDAFPAVPTVAEVRIASPGLNQVKEYVGRMRNYCVYPDQMFPQRTGTALNEVSSRILLGELAPEKGCELVEASWKEAREARAE